MFRIKYALPQAQKILHSFIFNEGRKNYEKVVQPDCCGSSCSINDPCGMWILLYGSRDNSSPRNDSSAHDGGSCGNQGARDDSRPGRNYSGANRSSHAGSD